MKFTNPQLMPSLPPAPLVRSLPSAPSTPSTPSAPSVPLNVQLGTMSARRPCMAFMRPSVQIGCGCGG